jgi:hypothetical protein
LKTQGNATIMAEIIGLPQMSTYDTKAIIQVSNKIYHHLKNRLKVGVGDLKKEYRCNAGENQDLLKVIR